MIPISRINNFDILRLLFATFVVISHSYWINGKYDVEVLNALTNQQIDLGALGVKGFFVISGFLVFNSLERSKTLMQFLAKRFLRIFPALIVMTMFIMFIMPLVYEGRTSVFSERSYWTFPAKVLMLFQFKVYVGGIFADHPMKEINMSLWTLCYEVACYLILSLLVFVRSKSLRFYLILAAFFGAWYSSAFRHLWLNERVFAHFNMYSYYFWDLACFFSAGALMAHFDFSRIQFRFGIVFLAVLGCILSVYFNLFYIFKYLFIPFVVILTGTYGKGIFINLENKFGDISYGVYIYGWFIQQVLYEFFKLDVVPLTLVALILVYPIGWLSWKFVEKPALKLKRFI